MSTIRRLKRFVRRIGALRRRGRVSREMDEEMRFHLDMEARELARVERLSSAEARRRARLAFGGLERFKQEAREVRMSIGLERLASDLKFAVRLIRRERLSSALAFLCLAIGVGATTTVFAVGHAFLLRPLPFPSGSRLVAISAANPNVGGGGGSMSYAELRAYESRQSTFGAIGAIQATRFAVGAVEPELVSGGRVTPGLFRALGVVAEAGRLLTEEDVRRRDGVVISAGLASRLFGSAGQAIGARLTVDKTPRTVVGVIADRWRYRSGHRIWVPLEADPEDWHDRFLAAIGALRPDAHLAAARADLEMIARELETEHPETNTDVSVRVTPLRDHLVGAGRRAFALVSAAALFVLLIASVNVANLMLARGSARVGELTVRTALGATRGRIARQVLTESALLAVSAGAAGVGLAALGGRFVSAAVLDSAPAWAAFGIDPPVLLFTLITSLVVGIGFGVIPALRQTPTDVAGVLRQSSPTAAGGRGNAFRDLLIVCQLALSCALLVAAGLAAQSVARLVRVDLGFEPEGVAVAMFSLSGPRYDAPEARVAFLRDLEARLSAAPGVAAVGAVTLVPIAQCCSRFSFTIEGRPVDPGREEWATGNIVTPGFFGALRIPVVRGRTFTEDDAPGAPSVMVVSRTMADRYWPGGDPIGERILIGSRPVTVVGVVADVKQTELTDAPEPQFYRPHAQDPWGSMTLVARAADGDATALTRPIRSAVSELDPTLPLYGVATMEQIVAGGSSKARRFGGILVALATVALPLAAAGVYGIVSFAVSRRRYEIGVRAALGAGRWRILKLVLGRSVALLAVGMGLGLVGSFVAARALARTLYGVGPAELAPYLLASSVLTAAVVAASAIPGSKAVRVSPTIALRDR